MFLFLLFYPRMNKPCIHTSIVDISSFQIRLNHTFKLTGAYFKSKIMEGSHEM